VDECKPLAAGTMTEAEAAVAYAETATKVGPCRLRQLHPSFVPASPQLDPSLITLGSIA